MPNLKMRLLPDGYSYSKAFHVRFSALCKTVRRTSNFYKEMAGIRSNIKQYGIGQVLKVLYMKRDENLSMTAQEYFESMKEELPKVGSELQSRVLTYLLCLTDQEKTS